MSQISPRDRGPFGTALKRFREERDVSQSKLAERAGFDHSYVSRLESGARTPTREAVDQLARALGLDPALTDRLRAAGGFLPRNVGAMLDGEPDVAELIVALGDERIRPDVRETLRDQVRGLTSMARLTIGYESVR